MTMTTIHEIAKETWRIHCVVHGTPKNKFKRIKVMRECAREAYRAYEWRMNSDYMPRDYREWRPDWEPGMPFMIGSGRSAHWEHLNYLQYSVIAQLLHKHLGWSGQRVRNAARALQQGVDGGGHEWLPPADSPTQATLQIASLPPGHYDECYIQQEQQDLRNGVDAGLAVLRCQWHLWLSRVAAPAWGAFKIDHMIRRLKRDPEYHTPSDVVGEIRRLRGDTSVTDLRWCSGCQYLPLVETIPELHDWLLSRAAPCKTLKLKSGIDAVGVQFGQEYPPEFDHVLVLGLSGELRVRNSDWQSLSGEQQRSELSCP